MTSGIQSIQRAIQEKLGLNFENISLLERAFFHTSYVNEQAHRQLQSNERLEFLGDAVLELCVSRFLYLTYPTYPEGVLTRMRAQLVREPSLAYVARQLGFNDYLQLGRGEVLTGGNQRDSLLADCVEAFIAAIYLDQGLDQAYAFIDRVLLKDHLEILEITNQDYKTRYQEAVQVHGSVKIEYRLLGQEGPAHDSTFTSGLYLEDQLQAVGTGKSKKEAEMKAAQIALGALSDKG